MYRCLRSIGSAVVLAVGMSLPASAQSIAALQDRARPDSSPLDRPARLAVADVALDAALARLSESSGVVIGFSPSLIQRATRTVSCDCAGATVAQALDRLLARTPFGYSVIDGQIVVTPNPAPSVTPAVPSVRSEEAPAVWNFADGWDEVLAPALEPVQEGTITGRVLSTGGAGLSAVTVSLEGTGIGTLTEADGRYRLTDVPAGSYRITAGSIGYRPETRTVVVRADEVVTVDFVLEQQTVRLDEVVVTVTGEQRRVEIGNTIGNIGADSLIAIAPVATVTDLVNARVPGVQVIQLSGMAGSSPEVRIRGLNSMSVSNGPLFIVDGVRVNNDAGTSTGLLAGFGQGGGRLNDLNPEEIESIEIVKGPSAATLYGTDAANGVVIINTKQGTTGPPLWNVYAEVGAVEPAASFVDNYHSWGHDADGNVRHCTVLQHAAAECAIDSLTTFSQMENPRTSPIGTGLRRQLGAHVRGGAAGFTYFLSGEHEREVGYFHMPEAEQDRLRVERGVSALPEEQIRPNWNDKLSLRANGAATFGGVDLTVSNGLVLGERQIPDPGALTSPAEYGRGYDDPETFGGWYRGRRPGETFSVRNTESYARYTGSLSGDWRPTGWLTTRGVVGVDLSNVHLDALQRNGEGPLGQGRAGRRQNTQATTAIYSADLGASMFFDLRPELTSRTSVGVQFNKRSNHLTSLTASDLPPGSETIRGAALLTGSETNEQGIVAGTYVEEVLGFADRLFLTAAMRFDGASSFGRDFRVAAYPKASVSWLAVEGGPDAAVTTLRLRGAYGVSGVQPGATDALTLYEVFTAQVDGAATAAARPSTLGNADLRPERQTELEAGFDAALYDGRISLEATYYNRLSRDALIERPLSPDVGVTSQWVNIGSVRNTGVEGMIAVQAIETPAFAWDFSLNGSVNDNTLEKLGLSGVDGVGPLSFRHAEGFPLYGRWEYPLLDYDDGNGNGIIEPDEVTVGDEPVYRGPGIPPRQLTLKTGVDLFDRTVRVSALFDHRGGMVQENGAKWNRCSAAIANCRAVNDPSTPLEEQARVVARNFQEDATFTRWRELSVSLNIPDRIASALRARNATLSLTGRNLAVVTDYSGTDPEGSPILGHPLAEGYQGNPTAPQSRLWILRLTLGL